MKIVLFVEGDTEQSAAPRFLKRWLDARVTKPVRIVAVRFRGWPAYEKEIATKVHLNLAPDDVLGGVGLLDLYGPTFYPTRVKGMAERYEWAKAHFESIVDHPKFRQHFAVHETEAWLLSESAIFPAGVRQHVAKISAPENVNFDEPPARLLRRLYKQHLGREYKKVITGTNLFLDLSPDAVYARCPHFQLVANDLLALATA